MIIEVPVKGYFEENCFFYIDDKTQHGFLIDPGAQAAGLLEFIKENGWEIEKILLTHGHFDHTGAANELRRVLNLPVLAYRTANDYLLDARKNLSGLCGPPITIRDATFIDDGDNITLEANPSFFLTQSIRRDTRRIPSPTTPPMITLHLWETRFSREALETINIRAGI